MLSLQCQEEGSKPATYELLASEHCAVTLWAVRPELHLDQHQGWSQQFEDGEGVWTETCSERVCFGGVQPSRGVWRAWSHKYSENLDSYSWIFYPKMKDKKDCADSISKCRCLAGDHCRPLFLFLFFCFFKPDHCYCYCAFHDYLD